MLGSRARGVGGLLFGMGICGLAIVGACAEKKGALMLAINTDMKAPKDVNAVSVTISSNGAIKHSFIGRVTPQGEVLLPATLAIAEGDDANASIRIRVIAFQDQKPRVMRDVRTTVPHGGRVALLRIPLNFVDDKSAVGPSLPNGLVPDPLPGTALPSDGGGAGTSGNLGGSASAGDFDFFGTFQPPCADIENQTIIDGECRDNFVDSNVLPDFDAGVIGDSTNAGTCFDLTQCFADAVAIPEGSADGAVPPPPGAVTVDLTSCVISLNGNDPARLNLAIATSDTGQCVRPGECYVPIDRGPGGWQDSNGTVQLPRFVCKLVSDKSLRLVSSEGTCAAKEERNAACATTPAEIADSGPASMPPVIAESFATSLSATGQLLIFAGSTRVASVSVADPTGMVTVYAVPPSKAPWRSNGAEVVNGSASGYLLRQGGAAATITVAPGTVDVTTGPAGGLAWAVSGGGELGGVYTSALTGAATRVPFPITQATALNGLGSGSTTSGALVGDASGNIQACDYNLKSCGTPIHLPSSARIDRITGQGADTYALAADGIYAFTLLGADGGTANEELSAPTLIRPAKTAAIVDSGVVYPRSMVIDTKCLFFTSADGVEWVSLTNPAIHGIVATAENPILGVTIAGGSASGAKPGGPLAVYYTVFADAAQGGGIYTAPLPAACLGATEADAGADAGPPTTCPSSAPIDTSGYPWKSPAVALGSCTQGELDTLVSFQTANPTASYLTLKNSVANPTCQGCIFGLQASATWAPILTLDGVQRSELDVGGCIAISTGNDACGRAYQALFDCQFAACVDCPAGDQAALGACLPAANNAACKSAVDSVTATCGATAVMNAEAACRTGTYLFEGPVKAQCVAGVP